MHKVTKKELHNTSEVLLALQSSKETFSTLVILIKIAMTIELTLKLFETNYVQL